MLSAFFTVVAFNYYRQLLDPSSPANARRTPQVRNEAYPSHYNPPYNASVPNLGYGYNMPYAGGPFQAPPGPPPSHDDYNKPPGYTGSDAALGYGAKDTKDPFADFDHERDVTSRPGPGGHETFR